MKLLNIILLALLLISCGDEEEGSGGNGHPVSLRLDLVKEGHAYEFFSFDNVFGSDHPEAQELELPGVTKFYQGTLKAHDGAKVRVYAALAPNAEIDRVLIQINGGTGTDSRHGLNNYNHKAVVMVSMRGLHTDDIRQGECALGSGLVECLKGVSWLKQVNPRDNGKDVVSVMKAILGEVPFTVDGESVGSSFFGATDSKFNIDTGSYGATILGYALAQGDLPAIGRIFIDGPSSPGEYVISDGFRNTKVALGNMLTAIGMSDSEKTSFLTVMKARHSAPNTTCEEVDDTDGLDSDCLSSSMIWEYLKSNYEDSSYSLTTLKSDMTGISDSEMAANDALVTKIQRGAGMAQFQTTWESSKFDFTSASVGQLLGGRSDLRVAGFASRVGQICAAYINRQNGDSWSRFNTLKDDADNNPYWYGFLIGYRVFLDICPEVAGNITTGIIVPTSSLNVQVEALVQYGAGVDEKHHMADIEEMESYVDGVVVNAYVPEHGQGGVGRANTDCIGDLREAAFETVTASLETGLASVKSNSCGL